MPRRNSPLDGLYDLFLLTPIWLAPSLALAAFILFRLLLPAMIPPPTPLDHWTLLRTLAPLASIFFPILILAAWLFAEFSKRRNRRRLDAHTSLDQIRSLSWSHFEQLIAEAFRRQGYTAVVTGSSGPDGGIDIHLSKFNQTTLVQCKHWKAYKVGVQPVRELLGLVTHHHAHHGIFVTSGRFTRQALAFAQNSPLTLIDGQQLAQLLPTLTSTPTSSPSAPTLAPPTPTCSACRLPMHLKTAKRGLNPGSHFWGCTNYPKCRQTIDAPSS